jgi:hypothetical protein
VGRVAGCAGAKRSIAPIMPPTPAPGRAAGGPRRYFFVKGEVIDFAPVAVSGFKMVLFAPERPLEAHAEVYAGGAGDVTTAQTWVGGGVLTVRLSANESNLQVHRREGQSCPDVYLPSCSYPAAAASRRCRP